jgi:glycosyltransferase involved in cell wall biosynthesis
MIEIEHDGLVIIKLFENSEQIVLPVFSKHLALISQFYKVAEHYPDKIIVWYYKNLKKNINTSYINEHFKPYMMWSYVQNSYIGSATGYVEDSPYLKINKEVKYPTWLMSSCFGAIHSNHLLKFKGIVKDDSIDFALNSIAKLGMPCGLWCYSVPQILLGSVNSSSNGATIYELYKFIALHYKKRWVILLFINLLIYERRFTFISLIWGIVHRKRVFDFNFEIETSPIRNSKLNYSLDVIIPTMGRKAYLYSFLKDLKLQTALPNKVIIIEQNPDETANSDLDYLIAEKWPFQIEHIFIHRTGACNARNIGLELVTSEYVFLADDDIRIYDKNLLQQTFDLFEKLDINIINLACLQKNEVDQTKVMKQWTAFGSGCSIILSRVIQNMKFNLAFEHGYGEDIDFGMQLRTKGHDIIYAPNLKLLHLKAPIGGFRSDLTGVNKNAETEAKPSPTVMLFRKLHSTKAQLKGYKIILCLKYYKVQHIRNPITYLKRFEQRWKMSENCADNINN